LRSIWQMFTTALPILNLFRLLMLLGFPQSCALAQRGCCEARRECRVALMFERMSA
jgi:hypothetical protein